MSTLSLSAQSEIIRIENLWVHYDQESVLEGINLFVKEGDYIGIIGPNGGGKTTLFKVILGLIPHQKGEIKILGEPVKKGRQYIGYVPQIMQFDAAFPITVADVVRMGRLGKRRLLQHYRKRDEVIVDRVLEQVGLLKWRDRALSELSGGQKQRVYIARALATEPKILLLDEPTANLDQNVSTTLYELLRQLNEFVTILMISHDISAVSAYVKTIGCLNRTFHYHGGNQLTSELLEQTYGDRVQQLVHVSKRFLAEHQQDRNNNA
ncbi:ABC transporter related protein [Halothece sp. PCC 7418]|uniref:metal ABC transporter ATP-binding protein n=1 Tax=Halothece sp. (strain PCC 7418) TaxID=65093 RepID=UPI0002A05DFB|nr:ABC transporter ATP-binding protein [Halothece sp. PCC 7418]AFZ42757.1 ABC transporter related protein [Halothece sp. PCC 7418]